MRGIYCVLHWAFMVDIVRIPRSVWVGWCFRFLFKSSFFWLVILESSEAVKDREEV
jgi:hypothetical protein